VIADPRGVLDRPAPPADLTVPYGDRPDQIIDVRLPHRAEPAPPVLIFLHGGFWRAEWDRAHAGPLAADLAGRGWAVACVEYRRGVGWPETSADVAAGVAAAPAAVDRALAARGWPPSRAGAVLAGHSAGGQLALWYAGTVARGLRGVLALAPVADLPAAYRADLDRGAVAELLGGGPDDVPDLYAAADPLAHPPRLPVTLLHGERDAQVPVELSRRYARMMGTTVTLRILPGVEHFGLIDPQSDAWPALIDELQTLTHLPLDTGAGCADGRR